MKRLKHLIIICIAVLGSFALNAQDIHFSQFYMSPLNLNPALTGVMNCNVRLVANYRNQWSSVLKSNAFKTYSVSYDQRIPVGRYDYFGIGGSFWGDKAGELDFATLQARLSLSYSKRMGGDRKTAHYLVLGADAGVTQRSVALHKARYGVQHDGNGGYDGSLPSLENFDQNNLLYPDLTAGLLWFSVLDEDNSFYFGAAYGHLNQADVSFQSQTFEAIYSKFTIHAGGEFMVADRMGLVPSAIVLMQGPSFEFNAGTNLKFLLGGSKRTNQSFQFGGYLRLSNHFVKSLTADAFIINTRFDYDAFSIGFSYDINVSSLRPASNSNGSFEFALIYKICGPQKRNVYCPNF
jgi:type IX secretion system PorP/SprF family membrane protein